MKNYVKRILCIALLTVTVLSMSACGSKDTLFTVDKYKIGYDEFRYYYLNTKYDFDGGDSSYWDTHADEKEQVKEQALSTLLHNYAIKVTAKKYDVKLSKDEKKAISEKISGYEEQYGGEEAFDKALAERYQNRDILRDTLEISSLWNKLYNYVTSEANGVIVADDATLLDDIKVNFARASQILIKNDDGDDTAENLALAQQLLDRLAGGEDFDTLRSEYSEDEHSKDNPNGYYFTRGQLIQPFEDAVFAMKEGELSGIVESSNGYHIILRQHMEDEYIDENIEELRICYLSRIFSEMLDECKNGLEVSYMPEFYELDPDSMQ